MNIPRKRERIAVDVPVTVTTVLDSLDATIIDLTENGAQIVGAALPAGTQFMVDHEGHSVFALVMWSEIDRMGVRFTFPLSDGPLLSALEMARASGDLPSFHPGEMAAGFGRRMHG